jgi:hypothetical protein
LYFEGTFSIPLEWQDVKSALFQDTQNKNKKQNLDFKGIIPPFLGGL